MRDNAAQILRSRRLELGMTQEEVAMQLGMTRSRSSFCP